MSHLAPPDFIILLPESFFKIMYMSITSMKRLLLSIVPPSPKIAIESIKNLKTLHPKGEGKKIKGDERMIQQNSFIFWTPVEREPLLLIRS